MDLLENFCYQFGYDAWASREVLSAIKASGSQLSSDRPLQLFAHILSAERLWLERIQERPQSLPVWPDFLLDQCDAQLAEVSELWSAYLEELSAPELLKTIHYKNSKGEAWSSTMHDVLTHVLLHSAYHRGGIAALMRAAGCVPASTDFIHAVRQGLIE